MKKSNLIIGILLLLAIVFCLTMILLSKDACDEQIIGISAIGSLGLNLFLIIMLKIKSKRNKNLNAKFLILMIFISISFYAKSQETSKIETKIHYGETIQEITIWTEFENDTLRYHRADLFRKKGILEEVDYKIFWEVDSFHWKVFQKEYKCLGEDCKPVHLGEFLEPRGDEEFSTLEELLAIILLNN